MSPKTNLSLSFSSASFLILPDTRLIYGITSLPRGRLELHSSGGKKDGNVRSSKGDDKREEKRKARVAAEEKKKAEEKREAEEKKKAEEKKSSGKK